MGEVAQTTGVVRILGAKPENQPLYSWLSELHRPWEAVSEYDSSWLPPADTDLLVTHRHYSPIEISVLGRTLAQGKTPILILADGILEWRNTWMNPRVTPASFFQPVLGHKLACLGASQARIITSWGNPGKCEIVGLPRLDGFMNAPSASEGLANDDRLAVKDNDEKKFHLLVMTARTPGFTTEQLQTTLRSLQELQTWLDTHLRLSGREIDVTWRLTGGLAEQLGVSNAMNSGHDGSDLKSQLVKADAVITTTSTTILEAALIGKPVAVLDYHGTPNYLTPAWAIRQQGDLDQVMSELVDPPSDRMLFQQQMLQDQLECQTPATPRILRLIEAMIEHGNECRRADKPLNYPQSLLREDTADHESVGHWISQRSLIEQEWANHYSSTDRLNQLALAQYESLLKECKELQKVNHELRSAGVTRAKKLSRLEEKRAEQDERIERLQQRVEELRDRVQKLRSMTQHYLESWKKNRKKLVEALGPGWVAANLMGPNSAVRPDAESKELEVEKTGDVLPATDEFEDEG